MEAQCAPPASRGRNARSKKRLTATISMLFTTFLMLLSAGSAHAVAGFNAAGWSLSSSVSTPVSTPQMQRAAKWAIAQVHSPNPTWSDYFDHPWSGYCEGFAAQAEGFTFGFDSAIEDYRWQKSHRRIHTDANPPAGALVYYAGGAYGHVAVSIGHGQEIGTIGSAGQRRAVRQYPVLGFLTSPYLGWANPIGS